MSDTVDGSTFTEDERAHIRASARILAAIAESRGPVPGLNNESIADVLGWSRERAKKVAKGLARTGLMARQSHIREVVERAKLGPFAPPERPMTDDITRPREHRLADNDLADANRARGLPADTTVAITDVDCTPRPRRGESQAAFDARIAGYMREAGHVQREVNQRNRVSAIRLVDDGGRVWRTLAEVPEHRGITAYFTQCQCGWCGLRVGDPEIARREYDAHACAAASLGDDAVSRAQRQADSASIGRKRVASVLQPTVIAPAQPAEAPAKRTTEQADDFGQRAALLELK